MPAHALVRDSQGYFHREAAHAGHLRGPPAPRRGERVDLPRGARRRAARLLPVPQQRAGRDRRARRGRRDRRAHPAAATSATRSRASASRAAATRTRCWTACSTTRPGRARPTCARACTTWTSSSATSPTQSVYVTIPNPLTPRSSWSRPTPTPPPAARGLDDRAARRRSGGASSSTSRAYMAALGHLEPWVAYADGDPFAYVETYRVGRGPAGRALRRAPRRPRLPHPGRRVRRRHGRCPRALVRQLVAGNEGRTVCEPDVRNARMLAFCRGARRRGPARARAADKRAALVVWER